MIRKKLLTAEDLAERYGFHRQTLYNLVNKKRIPFIKVGRALRFDEAEIELWEKHTEVLA